MADPFPCSQEGEGEVQGENEDQSEGQDPCEGEGQGYLQSRGNLSRHRVPGCQWRGENRTLTY